MVTPLARKIINQIMLPASERTMYDSVQVMHRMADVHCFEVTEVIEESNRLILEGGGLSAAEKMAQATCFLPAPKTWIEWLNDTGNRVGILLEDRKTYAHVSMTAESLHGVTSLPDTFGLPLIGGENVGTDILTADNISIETRYDLGRLAATLIGLLAFINTPRIIGRRQHVAKRTLEKKILKNRKDVSIFPLNAWTEIILRVKTPKDMIASGSKEAYLTGQKAMHFCRAHLRIQNGKLIVVRGHWRGDPSLGIKRSRYKVTL